jgi:ribosomal protein S17
MRGCFAFGFVCGLLACAAFAAEDVSTAVVATVKTVDKGAKTVVVKTADGTEHTFHFLGRTIAHGAKATAHGSKDAFEGVKEGDEVVVHYTVKGAEKTAEEVDHVGKDGMKAAEVTVKSFGPRSGSPTRCGNQVAAADYNFLDRPFDSVTLRFELALLDGAFDKDVVALVEGRGHQGEIPVE